MKYVTNESNEILKYTLFWMKTYLSNHQHFHSHSTQLTTQNFISFPALHWGYYYIRPKPNIDFNQQTFLQRHRWNAMLSNALTLCYLICGRLLGLHTSLNIGMFQSSRIGQDLVFFFALLQMIFNVEF